MGKSSTLRQLPDLLGAHYLPIFYDLQTPGISSSAATFLSVIAKEIYEVIGSSGVRAFGDMGMNWAGYFVNVQTLKVSFLQPVEALQLITRPVSNFPSEQVFGEGVVDEIMRVTGCHPFLVQAICSALIDYLNADNRNQAEIQDVAIAMSRGLKSWGSTYFQDLWERTNDDQRVCLIALKNLGEGTSSYIEQQTGLERRTVRRTLEILLDRDLILLNKDVYRIAAPIFYAWVERSNYD